MLGYGAIETIEIALAMSCLRDCFADQLGSLTARSSGPGP
jgi:hypothetical protein